MRPRPALLPIVFPAKAPLAALFPLALAFPLAAQPTLPFRPGMVITESARIEPGTYRAPGPATLDSALIVVRGDGITVDLTGVRLEGIAPEADPDLATGVAIRIDGGRDVTLRGAVVRGYRFAVLARGTRGLRLLDNELSYGWKPRLFSLVAHESLVDWLSFHENEEREWMRFGAAIYLEDVTGGEVRGNRAVQGMNGLLAVRSDSLRIEDNELAFNSGLGIGLYRSSANVIVRNRVDFNVRGYSHGFYQRGQDSAGILLYEQSSDNVIAYNSVTHGGDGLFLWAGRSTMDTGEGGANDNLVFGNDFSHAPTNAVEVTFSRNRIVANRLRDSRYGVWGGYSWETLIAGNCFGGNETGIAIEHGQDNLIDRNAFAGDGTAVAIWANPSEPEGWGYPRHRDTRSRDTRIAGNRFADHDRLWRFERTTGLDIVGNRFEADPPDGPCEPGALLGEDLSALAPDLPGVAAAVPEVALAGRDRSAIVVDEWGPYDWRSPKLWPADTGRARVPLRTLGPAGRWRVTGRRGVAALSAEAGAVGGTLVVTPHPDSVGAWTVALEYVGAATRSPRGVERPAGEPVAFGFERFEPIGAWDARYYAWSEDDADPAEAAGAFEALVAGEPLLARSEPRLSFVGYRPTFPGVPPQRWGLEAEATVRLPPGAYTLRAISDDGVRVWVDGELAIDAREPHGSRVDHAPLEGGEHELRVRYYQLDGWAELRVEIVRGVVRSKGSAGPH